MPDSKKLVRRLIGGKNHFFSRRSILSKILVDGGGWVGGDGGEAVEMGFLEKIEKLKLFWV